jgi:hypothetical protein
MNEEKDDYVMIFEAPKIEPPEFRLYYEEETGKVLFYTCEKPEGKFIIIDSVTFACARQDVRVVDGKLSTVNPALVISKLIPNDQQGIKCLKEDISIIAEDTINEVQLWKLETYELG